MSTIQRLNTDNLSNGLKTNQNSQVSENTGLSFKNFLDKNQKDSLGELISSGLNKLEGSWNSSQNKSNNLVKSLPESYKPLFEAQVSVQRMHFQSEMLTKIADSVQGAVKRLQQQGS